MHCRSHHQTPRSSFQIDVLSTSRSKFYPQPLSTWKTTGDWRSYSSFKQLFLLEQQCETTIRLSVSGLSALFVFQGLIAAHRTSVASHNMKTHDLNSCEVHMLQSISSDRIGFVRALLLRCFALLPLWALQIFKLWQKTQYMAAEEGRGKGCFLNAHIETTKDVGITLLVNFSYDSNHCQSKYIIMEAIKICAHSFIVVTIGKGGSLSEIQVRCVMHPS